MPESFSVRLQKCVSKADLTVSDVARWFKRPRATVNTWMNGRCPWGPAGDAAFSDLDLLEWAGKHGQLPLPKRLTLKARMAQLNDAYEHAARNARVPSLRPAAGNR
jgi:hypothetical protein